MPYPPFTYASSNWTVPYPVSGPVFSRPIPGVNVDYVLRQNFVVRKDEFEPLPLNTPYDESFEGADQFAEWSEFVLVEEGDERDIGGGCVEWTRTYAKLPATHSEPTEVSFLRIGFYGTFGINITEVTGRDAKQVYAPGRIQYDYFLLEEGQDIDEVPIEPEQEYYVSIPSIKTDYLADSPPFTPATTPSRTEYQTMIDNEVEIVIQPSRRVRWMGNIVQRQTIYTKAQ